MRTANIAGALFVVGLLVSGNLAVGGVQPSNIVLASIISSPTSSFLAEVYLPDTGESNSSSLIQTLRIEIDAKDGLQSCYSVVSLDKSGIFAATNLQPEDTQYSTGSLSALHHSLSTADRPTTAGEAYLNGQQVAHSLFRYDSVKAPDIPRNI